MVIGTDCTGSCKFNYHTITTTHLNKYSEKNRNKQMLVRIFSVLFIHTWTLDILLWVSITVIFGHVPNQILGHKHFKHKCFQFIPTQNVQRNFYFKKKKFLGRLSRKPNIFLKQDHHRTTANFCIICLSSVYQKGRVKTWKSNNDGGRASPDDKSSNDIWPVEIINLLFSKTIKVLFIYKTH
jgi:hypothetical protein